MIKKIIGLGIIGIAILLIIGIILSYYSIKEISDDSDMMIKGDVIMPTKVSRPGCEKIDKCYVPSVIEIKKGKQVTWINEDSAFHSVTSGFYDSPSELFDSGYLDPFESYTVVFDDIGTYDYFCTLHPWMKGQVIVK
ncbi:MAG: cupredoxin domain-containing protein [Nitrosopumilus sp.]|uniref:cupredoxin domain-containing protein n=1 Tax=Nitrosopumilus sp. TaxID=2024843 RepID=UPI00247E62E8|nr:plastocyanin/azurin family copper-binding protein [Nitrosopumilus sp.]MCV0392840.1 cupredoxin domain-containing protein [Nitrosopumilus sp.]